MRYQVIMSDGSSFLTDFHAIGRVSGPDGREVLPGRMFEVKHPSIDHPTAEWINHRHIARIVDLVDASIR